MCQRLVGYARTQPLLCVHSLVRPSFVFRAWLKATDRTLVPSLATGGGGLSLAEWNQGFFFSPGLWQYVIVLFLWIGEPFLSLSTFSSFLTIVTAVLAIARCVHVWASGHREEGNAILLGFIWLCLCFRGKVSAFLGKEPLFLIKIKLELNFCVLRWKFLCFAWSK